MSSHSCDSDATAVTAEMMTFIRNVNSSIQRIEGHCFLMDQRTSTILDRVTAVEHQVVPLATQQADMDARLSQLFHRVAAVEVPNHREVGGGGVAASARSFSANSGGGRWMCPICRSGVLMRALTLKGHIRKLLPGNSSSRPKCRWKPSDNAHQLLVARFEGSTFEERCSAFASVFYSFLQAATSSSHSESETTDLITAWLSAALSVDNQPLPVLPHCSSSSGSRRRLPSSSDQKSSSDNR
jgi:hypothetical protein